MERKRQKWIIEDGRGQRPGQKFEFLPVLQKILKYADNENALLSGRAFFQHLPTLQKSQ